MDSIERLKQLECKVDKLREKILLADKKIENIDGLEKLVQDFKQCEHQLQLVQSMWLQALIDRLPQQTVVSILDAVFKQLDSQK